MAKNGAFVGRFSRLLVVAAAGLLIGSPVRSSADDRPLSFSAVNVADLFSNLDGGLRRGTRALGKLDVMARYIGDTESFPGLSAFLDLQLTNEAAFSEDFVGDAQGVSNIDAPGGVRLANAWIAKEFDGLGGLKAGLIDLNSEFDVQRTAALFLNSSQGIGPDFAQTGLNGPSIFPSTGLGVVGWWLPGGHWEVKTGIFEGIPGNADRPGRTVIDFSADEGVLLTLEAHYRPTPDLVLGAGVWSYTAAFDTIEAADPVRDNAGFYASADGTLYKAGFNETLNGWIRAGFANDDINPIAFYLGGGLVYTGAFGREGDQVGVAFARAQFGAQARRAAQLAGGTLSAETTLEATYSYVVSETATVQPDLQYVIAPGGDPSLPDALVAGVRLTVSWEQ